MSRRNYRPLLVVCLALGGCAQDPDIAAMVPAHMRPSPTTSEKTVAVMLAQGGEDTNPFIAPSIGDAGFRKAVQLTLERSGLFRGAFLDQNADYLLYPEVLTQELIPGLKMTAVLHTHYRLIEDWSDKKLWEGRILTVYDADLGQGLYGLARARAALEGAVRKNLEKLVQDLAQRIASERGE